MRKIRKDLTGLKFGGLTAIRPLIEDGAKIKWVCSCECGGETVTCGTRLKTGHTKSCGCRISSVLKERNTTHGLRQTPEYRIWAGMNNRCHNPNENSYPRYGGRGITVCDEWRDDFMAFFSHIGPRPSVKHSIDRIDNDLGYKPGNVRWATREQQSRNRECIVEHEFNGVRATIPELAAIHGYPAQEIRKRLWRGWSIERALTQPMRKSPITSRAA